MGVAVGVAVRVGVSVGFGVCVGVVVGVVVGVALGVAVRVTVGAVVKVGVAVRVVTGQIAASHGRLARQWPAPMNSTATSGRVSAPAHAIHVDFSLRRTSASQDHSHSPGRYLKWGELSSWSAAISLYQGNPHRSIVPAVALPDVQQ